MALVRRQPRTPERSTDFPDLFARSPWSGLLTNWEAFRELLEDTGVPVEEYQEDGTHVVKAELPGIDPDQDVDITVQDGVLRIRAERRQEEKNEQRDFYRQEIRYGSFARNIPLPAGASEEDIKAEYSDGVLTVRLPLKEEKQGTKIPIRPRLSLTVDPGILARPGRITSEDLAAPRTGGNPTFRCGGRTQRSSRCQPGAVC